MPELVSRIKDTYCTTTSCCRCARFQIAQNVGLDAVPHLMLPNQTEWASQILAECVPESDRDSDPDLEKDGQPVEV
jgi:4'-phosphopantetheinyl transferase EntD